MAKTGMKAVTKKTAGKKVAAAKKPAANAKAIVRPSPGRKKLTGKKKPPGATLKKPAAKKAAGTRAATKNSVIRKAAPKKAVARKAVLQPTKAPQVVPPAPAQDGRAPGSPWLIPTLIVRTAEAAIDFYQRAFGFTVDFTMPSPTGAIGYAQLRHQSALIHLSPEGAYGLDARAPVTAAVDCPATFYVYCANVDAMVAQARAAGATILSEPADMFWGDRVASLSDPEGYRWAFASHVRAFDASKPPPADYPKPG